MQNEEKRVLITGIAGFIGFHLACSLIKTLPTEQSLLIIGLDNINSYYETSLKRERLRIISGLAESHPNVKYLFYEKDLNDRPVLTELFKAFSPQIIINLAAQAGVRYSIENPDAYISSNVVGFFNILECCRKYPVEQLIFASSSSVYGDSSSIPHRTSDKTDSPVSLYAATKKAGELLAFSYSKLYGIPMTGLRFFTVYGPFGRPDMAYFSFAKKLIKGQSIDIFNFGNCKRDFTYVEDVVRGIELVMERPPENNEGGVPYRLYNIGHGSPVDLLEFVTILQNELIRAGLLPEDYDPAGHRRLVKMQKGDVPITFADTKDFERDFGYTPATSLSDGLRKFVQWFADFYYPELTKVK